MRTSDLIHYLDDYLQIARYADRSNNGLQVQGNGDIARVAFAVDACLASFGAAIAERAQLLIVHHGLFWSDHLQITGAHYERVKALICAECGLYAAHIPLDAHAEAGNNIELARIIGVGGPAMVAIVDFLEAQGWLRREAHDGDRRANHLVLTAKGRAHLERAKALLLALDERWTSRLTAAERAALTELLDKVGPPPSR